MSVGRIVALNLAVALATVAIGFFLPPTSRRLLGFFVVVYGILLQTLWFLYRSIVVHLPGSQGKRLFLLWTLFSSTAFFMAKLLPSQHVLIEVAFLCLLGNVWALFLVLFFRAIRAVAGKRMMSRRGEAVAIVLLMAMLMGAAHYEARLEYEINRVNVRLGLKRPLSITLISDTHLGPVLGLDFCQRVEQTVAKLDSDIVVLVGDIFDSHFEKIPKMVSQCVGRLRSRHGVYYVSGNHEHINGDLHHWLDELRAHNVIVLQNDCHSLSDEFGANVIGIVDLSADRFAGGYRAEPEKAVAACGEKDAAITKAKKIVLAHQPNHHSDITRAVGDDDYLLLSGHVHGGQIWPAKYLVALFNDFFAGFYTRGRLQVYVGRGTGQWGPRLRLSARAEIAQINVT